MYRNYLDSMKLSVHISCVISILFMVLLAGCAKKNPFNPVNEEPSLQDIQFGMPETLEIVTWNIETFPKQTTTTVQMVSEIILAIYADIYALQEIESRSYFNLLIDQLNQSDTLHTWEGFRAGGSSTWMELSYILKTDVFDEIQEPFEIYDSEGSAFPREPYILDIIFNGNSVKIINNHLKCCSGPENESRRQSASELLQEYIEENMDNDKVIVVGDWNDEIAEPQQSNVFWNFIDDDAEYQFSDMDIALDPTHRSWSYPSYPSHIDHILITSELFDSFADPRSKIKTIRVFDSLPGGFSEYNQKISDHLPVALRLEF